MGRWPGLVVSALLPYYLLVACMVAVAHATSDEAADGMDHFEVKVGHIEISGSPSWSVELVWDHPASSYAISYQGPNGTLLHYGEGATVDAPVAFISSLSNGPYQFKVQTLKCTSIVATGSVTLEILDIYWQTSYGSGGSTVNGSFISSVKYSIVGSDVSKIIGYTVNRSVNGSDHIPYLWQSEPAFDVIEPGWPGSMYSYSVYANASAFSTASARPVEA